MQHADKAARPAADAVRRPALAAHAATGSVRQRGTLPLAVPSPRIEASRAWSEGIHDSPRMVAQRQRLPGPSGLSGGPPGLQRRRAGKHQEADLEAAKIVITPGIETVSAADRDNARAAMDAARATAEARVDEESRQVNQPHGGNLAELKARWHNDQVHRYERGYVEAGHGKRTSLVEDAYVERRAAETAAARVRAERTRNAAIQETVVQLQPGSAGLRRREGP